MLTPKNLAINRQFAMTFIMTDRCIVYKRSTSITTTNADSDGRGGIRRNIGGAIDNYTPQPPVAARLQKDTRHYSSGVFGGVSIELADSVVVLPVDTPVRRQDKLLVTVDGQDTMFEIKAIGRSTERFTLPVLVTET